MIPTAWSPSRHVERRRLVAVLALTLAAVTSGAAGSAALPVRAATAAQSAPGQTYRLVDTWANAPWRLTAGRFTEASDVSSAPDGTIYVLDAYQGAIHVLAPDGTPRRVFSVPGSTPDEWVPRRLDVGFDGRVYVLSDGQKPSSTGGFSTRIDRLSPDGEVELRFEVGALVPQAYVDVAARSDGRIYVSRTGEGNPYITWPGPTPTPDTGGGRPDKAVDVFADNGVYLESLAPPELAVPGNLDVARDGTIYVVNRVPSPYGDPPVGPDPTPRPSYAGDAPIGARASSADQQPAPTATPVVTPIEGVLILEPDHRYRETVPFHGGEDVAVGPAGVFVSRNVEIYALREREPLYLGLAGRVVNAYFGRTVLNLDATADGRLLASMNHCYFQGVLVFDDPSARPAPARAIGENDSPYLEGPPYPLRVAASDELAVLLGRFEATGTPPNRRYLATNYLFEAQSVQRWARYGQHAAALPLRSQMGLCAGSDSWWTRDVAIDGRDVYTVDPNLMQLRPDDRLPRWTLAPVLIDNPDDASQLIAVAADGGRAAALDAGTGAVYVVDRDGHLLTHWAVADGVVNALPTDLAVHGDRVYLADLGRGRITVRALADGAALGEWSTHDGPRAVATGPDGSVFVLGRGGWGFRYAADGTLLAAWPMPDRAVDAEDIAVDTDGRVYVTYVERERLGEPDQGRQIIAFGIARAGIWVFEPAAAAPAPPPAVDACLARPDKWAAPRRLPLGDEVEVTLTVDGRCPGAYDPVQIVLVLDTSRSMNFSDALGRAREAVAALLSRLDPRAAEVGLVTFEAGAALKAPLSRDIAAAGTLAMAQDATGDTLLTPGLELARRELTGPRGNPSARRIVLIISDGIFHDDPLAAADAVRADGLELWALVSPTYEYNPVNRTLLDAIVGNPDRVYVDPDPTQLADMSDGLIRYRAQSGLFQSITVEDVVPANMRYVAGSSAPVAAWDAARRTLTWRFGRVMAADPIELHYRLQPQVAGTWPTNVEASAPYRDVLGIDGKLVFPVPEVEVYGLATTVYLPFVADRSCFRTDRPLDIVLVIDTSSTMGEDAPAGGTKLEAAQAAARTFLDLLRWPDDHAALVAFDVAARREVGLTGEPAALDSAIDRLRTTQGTHIDLGLAEARRVLVDGGRPQAKPVVILLSDGLNNAGPAPVLDAVAPLKSTGALLYAIGLGSDVDATLLRQVATTAERYYAAPDAGDLADIYRQISEQLACDVP
jgi:Mg-chelatase subunit ChlD